MSTSRAVENDIRKVVPAHDLQMIVSNIGSQRRSFGHLHQQLRPCIPPSSR